MSECQTDWLAPLRCPTFAEVLAAALALLPRGRAWQSNEGGAQSSSILWRFWAAVADVYTFLNQRFCALRLEFWCASESETNDLWLAEYGLPNACDPYPDLCTKVAALGGARCEFYGMIAARAGWSISCNNARCSSRAAGRRARAGRMRAGRAVPNMVHIIVDLGRSSAFTGLRFKRARAGRVRAGRRLSCGPDLGPLECIMARVVHAEIQITYEAING